MTKLKIILRQLLRRPKQAAVFVLSVLLSLLTLSALNGFSESLSRSLLIDARKLHAADIIIQSYEPISPGLEKALDEAQRRQRIVWSEYNRFYSVVRTADDRSSLLSALKVVDDQYPFYGRVVLSSGRSFHSVLSPGRVVVAQTVLDSLGLKVGDLLKIGYATLTIGDVVLAEPDRPVNIFSLGPRIFLAMEDRDALGLIQTGSRVRYVRLVKVMDQQLLDTLAAQFKTVSQQDRESIETYKTARSGIKRFLDNFLFYLNLVGIFILIISGVGIQSALSAFFREKQKTIAIMKTLGATNAYITRHFAWIVSILGFIGIALGIAAGVVVQFGLSRALASFLPTKVEFYLSWSALLEGGALGLGVVAIFSFPPLYKLRDMRPVMIFRDEKNTSRYHWPYFITGIVLALFVLVLVFWHMQKLQFGLYVAGAIGGIILIATLLTNVLLLVLRPLKIHWLVLRQAVKGLFRLGNATRSVVITLTASLCVILSIFLIEKNLNATFIDAFPEDAPNLFFIDIQPSQIEAFEKVAAQDVQFYPIVRARVTAINNQPINRSEERQKKRDNFSRVFNLTYRSSLLDDEKIEEGQALFRRDWRDVQVSVLDRVTKMRPMAIGDTLTFNIQGVPLKARISSIRSRTHDNLRPYFYFVFKQETLATAPHTLFTALKVDRGETGKIQSRFVAQFPNISVIDLSETISSFGRIMRQLSTIVRLFSILSIAAGILILISAIFATRAERMIESVYYKILGAKKAFVFYVMTCENLMIGLLSSFTALGMAQIAAYAICHHLFDLAYQPFVLHCLVFLAGILILVISIGLATSASILQKKPASYLQERPDG